MKTTLQRIWDTIVVLLSVEVAKNTIQPQAKSHVRIVGFT